MTRMVITTIYKIPFTQYVLPNGEQRAVWHESTEKKVADKAQEILNQNYAFEIEVLRTGEISVTIKDKVTDRDVAMELAGGNDERVTAAINKMILGFTPLPIQSRVK